MAACPHPSPDPHQARLSEQISLKGHPIRLPHMARGVNALQIQASRKDFKGYHLSLNGLFKSNSLK